MSLAALRKETARIGRRVSLAALWSRGQRPPWADAIDEWQRAGKTDLLCAALKEHGPLVFQDSRVVKHLWRLWVVARVAARKDPMEPHVIGSAIDPATARGELKALGAVLLPARRRTGRPPLEGDLRLVLEWFRYVDCLERLQGAHPNPPRHQRRKQVLDEFSTGTGNVVLSPPPPGVDPFSGDPEKVAFAYVAQRRSLQVATVRRRFLATLNPRQKVRR